MQFWNISHLCLWLCAILIVLNRHVHTIRPFLGAFLLFTVLFQQVAGRFYVCMVYTTEVAADMNDEEKNIADILETRTGIETRIKAVDQQHLQFYQRMGYAAPFVFSEEVNGEVCFFTVGDERVKMKSHAIVAKNHSAPEDQPRSNTLLIKLFSAHYFHAQEPFPELRDTDQTNERVFPLPHRHLDPDLSNLSPPPERV